MAEITAAAVKALRERTNLPLMDCKKALTEAGGDQDKAVDILREKGAAKFTEKFADRDTSFGRYGMHIGEDVGAMVELKCESAPVTQNDEFIALAADLAKQLATGPGADSPEALLAQPSPSKDGTLQDQLDELFNRIREKFEVGRMVRTEGRCGGYEHKGSVVHGVLLEADGGTQDQLRDISMHVAAMNPASLSADDLDPSVVEKEREVLRNAALAEGKPENIVDKMVDGRMRNFYAERVLTEQEFVKGENKETVSAFAKANGITLKSFTHWQFSPAS